MNQPGSFAVQDRFNSLESKCDIGAYPTQLSRCLTSGVQSRMPKPVPPVVTIQSTFLCITQETIVFRISALSSGTIACTSHVNFG